MSSNEHRRVVVIGAASGIGLAIVRKCREQGALAAALDLSRDVMSVEAEHVGTVDVSDWDAMNAAMQKATGVLGGLDALVVSSGVIKRGTVEETSVESWQRQFAVNALGPFIASKLALPYLRGAGGGSIVFVASQVGLVGAPACAAYGPSKAAVIQLARCLAVDHSREGICVNALCPGITEGTGVFEDSVGYYEGLSREQELDRMRGTSLQGRLLSVEEIAECAAFLVSPVSSGVTGSSLVVDGGYTAW